MYSKCLIDFIILVQSSQNLNTKHNTNEWFYSLYFLSLWFYFLSEACKDIVYKWMKEKYGSSWEK